MSNDGNAGTHHIYTVDLEEIAANHVGEHKDSDDAEVIGSAIRDGELRLMVNWRDSSE